MNSIIVHDPIGDMINRLKIAGKMKRDRIIVPYSKLRFAVGSLLKEKGFVKSVAKKGKRVVKSMEVELAYHTDGEPRIADARRISKLSRRVYFSAKDIHPVRRGYGMLVMTTPQGIMSGDDAKKQKVGGEALFEIF